MRGTLLLVLLLSVCGCGDSDHTTTGTAPQYPLHGFWGGYFPGSSLENPGAGVEVHFERQGRNGFIHRDTGAAQRALVTVARKGNRVTLTFSGTDGDVATFRGKFVDADRIRGRFTNASRGESFAMDLISAESVGRALPTQGVDPTPVPGPPHQHLTLQITATTEDGTTYTFLNGFGYYYNPGTWTTQDTIPNGPTDTFTGPSAVLQLLFFPSWIVFDLYAYPSQLILSASIEVPLADFAKVNPDHPQDLTPYNTSIVGVWPDDVPVTAVHMSYVATDDFLDREGWGADAVSPEEVTILYDDKRYTVPFNAASLLLGFKDVGEVVREDVAAPAAR